MANNTTVDPIDYKNPKIKCLNLIKAKEHIQNLYRRYGSLADAINTLIGEGDDTPNVIDNLSEAISITREVDARRNDVYTHIHHIGDGTVSPKETFTATANSVDLNYQCKHLLDDTYTQHTGSIPIANSTQAGIITSEGGAFFDENTTGKVDTLDSLKDFLDGVEENELSSKIEVLHISTQTLENPDSYNDMKEFYFSMSQLQPDDETQFNNFINNNANKLFVYESSDSSAPKNYHFILDFSNISLNDFSDKLYADSTLYISIGNEEYQLQKNSTGIYTLTLNNKTYNVQFNYYITEMSDYKYYDVILQKPGFPSYEYIFPTAGNDIKIYFKETKVTPLETRLDEKLGKTVYNTTDANNILKGLVLHSSTNLQVGPLEITLPFKLDSSIQPTEQNVNSMLEGVWIIDITGSIYEIVDDDTMVQLVKITDQTTVYSYSFPQFINGNEIKLTLAL